MNAEDVRKNIDELQALRVQTRNWKLLMVGGILIIVIGCVWNIIASAKALIDPGPTQTVFMTELKSGLEKDVKPNAELILKSTLTHIQKEAQEELRKLNDRTPELIGAVQKELTMSLTENIPKRGTEIIQASVGRALKQQEAALRKDFPNVTEAKVTILVTNLVDEAYAQILDLKDTLFLPHMKALENIYASLDAIQTLEGPNIVGETPTWDMAILVFDIMREELRHAEMEGEAGKTTTASEQKKAPEKKKSRKEAKATTAKTEGKETP